MKNNFLMETENKEIAQEKISEIEEEFDINDFYNLYIEHLEKKSKLEKEVKKLNNLEQERKENLLKTEAKYTVLLDELQKEFQEKTNKKLKIVEILAYITSFLALVVGILIEFTERKPGFNYALALVFMALILVGTYMAFIYYKTTKKNRLKKDISSIETQLIKNKIEDNFFENSIELSYKYLDQYYKQIEEQAKKGFALTVSAAVVGAILIAIGIVAMFFNKVSPSRLTCISGISIEFISAIFFYIYNKTMNNMGEYHNKLVLSHNISIALKTAELLPDGSSNLAKHKIIEALLKNVNAHLVNDKANKKDEDK